MRKFSLPTILIGVLLFAAACSSVAVTGRKQLSLVPMSNVLSMSAGQYSQFIAEAPLSTDAQKTELIRRVGGRISQAVETYLRENGFESELQHYNWEFNLVDSDEMNAWCMPGGKVVFYTGILDVCRDEAGVAVVMGHEVAHAVAHHGRERMSQQILQVAGAAAVTVATKDEDPATRAAWLAAYGLGSQVGVMLPFSRSHESEADRMGLVFMAMAGYDPRNAPEFWKRMADGGGEKPPEFLSTHPADATRVRKLNENMSEAMSYYKPAP